MTIIRIQEQTTGENNALLSFDHNTQYPIQISDPFNPEQESNLEWYFEEHLNFPFTQHVRAREAAATIRTYGISLFTQLFSNPGARDHYRQSIAKGLHTLQIEIVGTPAFHRLHWETLYDPNLNLPLAQHVPLIRQNTIPQTFPSIMQPSQTINVLLVVARPRGTRDVGYRTISRPLLDTLQKSGQPVSLTLLRPGTYKALDTHLETTTREKGIGHYHIIHFDVHGSLLTYKTFEATTAPTQNYIYQERYGRSDIPSYSGEKAFLSLESERLDQPDPVEAIELAQLLLRHRIPIVILNACQSGKSTGESEGTLGSHLIQAGIQNVLAMGYSITVTAAERLMPILYRELLAHQPLATALCLGRQELFNQKARRAYYNEKIDLEDWMLPIVYQNSPVHFALQPLTAQQQSAQLEKETAYYQPPKQPGYGFIGRDIDILQIEKRLLTNRNILLIRGMGGAGKTTLLHHLAVWWQRTGFVQQVFYFGYDDKAWNRQQIMRAIAQKLLGKEDFALFQSCNPELQQLQLSQLLKTTPHLLILDNLESVTGSKLAIPHTLSKKEQTFLHTFLKELLGGQTRVLLGSRSTEDWLKTDTFQDNRHDLLGLDPEAASLLVEHILQRTSTTHYRADKKLQDLITLLDGFPLALEVVLSNLVHQTPTQILTALQSGDTTLKTGTSEQRTENILKCIDYSYSNLSPAAQQLLLCLAPFTSVIFRDTLHLYAEELQKQPALAHLPFDHWNEFLQEAENWGLLSPDPNVPQFLNIQPILPYFLRQRSSNLEQHTQRTAIETAFLTYYQELSGSFNKLIESKEPKKRQLGFLLAQFEYENILAALRFALNEKRSLIAIYQVLDNYLNHQQEYQRGQELDTLILSSLETLSKTELTEQISKEFIQISGFSANRQLALKQYEAATQTYKKVLQILETTSIEPKQCQIWQASTLHQLGMVAQEQREWEQAWEYYQQALEIFIIYQDRHSQARTLRNLGMVAQKQQEWEQAKTYYLQALEIFISYQDRYEQARTLHQLGNTAQEQREWEQAKTYYLQALEIFISYQDRYEQARTLHQLGRVAEEQQQWIEAKQYHFSASYLDRDQGINNERVLSINFAGEDNAEAILSQTRIDSVQQFLENAGFDLKPLPSGIGLMAHARKDVWKAWFHKGLYIRILFDNQLDQHIVEDITHDARKHSCDHALVVINQQPMSSGWAQVNILRSELGSRRFICLPLDETLIQKGVAINNEFSILKQYITHRLGDGFDPYDEDSYVTGVVNFYGRQRIAEEIMEDLQHGRRLGLFGIHKMGKSSVLKELQSRATFPVAYVYLTVGKSLGHIYKCILEEWATSGRVKYPDFRWEAPQITTESTAQSEFDAATKDLLSYLDRLNKVIPSLAIFLDEIEHIVPSEGDEKTLELYIHLMDSLRGLHQETQSLSLLVAGVNPKVARDNFFWGTHKNPMHQIIKEYFLPPLDEGDCTNMVRSLGQQINIKYERDALECIMKMSGSHPLLARRICSYAQKKPRDSKSISVDIIDEVIQEFVRDPQKNAYFGENGLWNELGQASYWGKEVSQANKQLLLKLAQEERDISEKELCAGLDQAVATQALYVLRERSIISSPNNSGYYHITFGLFKNWIRFRQLGLM